MKKFFLLIYGILIIFLLVFNFYADASTSGLEPDSSIQGLLNASYVESVEFKQATVADFCEIDFNTDECTSITKEIISGYAVLKYNTSEILEILPDSKKNDPSYNVQKESFVFGLMILDNGIYISFMPRGTGVVVTPEGGVSLENTLTTLGESVGTDYSIETTIINGVEKRRTVPIERTWEWEMGSRLLPEGLDRHKAFAFNETQNFDVWEKIYIFTLDVSQGEDVITPEGNRYPSFILNSIIPDKKYRLIEVKNTLKDFEIEI